jgi:hypothetical protein
MSASGKFAKSPRFTLFAPTNFRTPSPKPDFEGMKPYFQGMEGDFQAHLLTGKGQPRRAERLLMRG